VSFAAVARKYSDDVASAREGGQLGMIAHGMLPQELDGRVFQIPIGQVGEPMVSRFGVHIFKVNGRSTRPLEQVRTGIAQRVRQQNMFDRVEILRRNAKIDFDDKFFPEAKKWPGRKPS
jgi:parvulin-like peptidyl-prolyl isomerase